MKKIRKIVPVLFLVLALCCCSFTVVAKASLSYEEMLAAVYESNVKANAYGAELADVSYNAQPYTGEDFAELNKKAEEIVTGLSTDEEKASAINAWVADNVYYDYDAYYHGSKKYPSPYAPDVFSTGLAVCTGYTNLMTAMCRAVGVPARCVTGAGMTSYYTNESHIKMYENRGSNHAWVEVYFGGKWNMCDPTWDSGNKYEYGQKVHGKNNLRGYFALDVKEFSADHFIVEYDDDLKIGDFLIHINSDSIGVSKYLGSKENNKLIIIPDGVTEICSNVFANFSALETVKLPQTMETIGYGAFENCTSLKTIVFPSGLKKIETQAFLGCSALNGIVIPNTVEEIGSKAFNKCSNLESIVIPDSVTTLGESVFEGCLALVNVKLGAGLTELPDRAFMNCVELVEVSGGENIVRIGQYCFKEDSKFTGNDFLMRLNYMGEYALQNCKNVKSFRLPTRSINNSSNFSNMSSLEEVVVTEGCRDIPAYSFQNCQNLKKINIPGSVTNFGQRAFSNCYSLKLITIPEGITKIGAWTFGQCSKLSSVYIPDSVTSIENYAFYYCSSLSKVYYGGTKEEWDSIVINQTGNNWLTNAEIIFEHKHTFSESICESFDGSGKIRVLKCVDCGFEKTEEYEEHTHTFNAVVTPVTCESDGFTTYSCAECDYSYTADIVKTTGHSYYWYILKNENCTKDGEKVKKCFKCDKEFETVVIKSPGHSVVWIVDKEATCLEEGTKHEHCTVCGKDFDPVAIKNGFHIVSGWTIDTDSTCTKTGEKHKECTVCKTVFEKATIEKKNHTSSSWIIDTDSTCTKTGEKHKECTVCKTVLEKAAVEKKNHTVSGWIVDKDSTCTSTGIRHTSCAVCGEIINRETIALKAHNDADGNGKCDVCAKELKSCSHLCHKDGFSGFIWKIVNFFNKIFKINRNCSCGKLHW